MVSYFEEIVHQVLDTIRHLVIAIMQQMFNAHQLKNKHEKVQLTKQIKKKIKYKEKFLLKK